MKKILIGLLSGIILGFLITNYTYNLQTNQNASVEVKNEEVSDSLSKEKLIILVNGERLKRGISGLNINQDLEIFAETRAKEIANSGEKRHEGLEQHRKEGTLPKECASDRLGENIYYNTSFISLTNYEVINGWMSSPAHRPNILNKNYIYYGLGIYKNNVSLELCLRENSSFEEGLFHE